MHSKSLQIYFLPKIFFCNLQVTEFQLNLNWLHPIQLFNMISRYNLHVLLSVIAYFLSIIIAIDSCNSNKNFLLNPKWNWNLIKIQRICCRYRQRTKKEKCFFFWCTVKNWKESINNKFKKEKGKKKNNKNHDNKEEHLRCSENDVNSRLCASFCSRSFNANNWRRKIKTHMPNC